MQHEPPARAILACICLSRTRVDGTIPQLNYCFVCTAQQFFLCRDLTSPLASYLVCQLLCSMFFEDSKTISGQLSTQERVRDLQSLPF
jgi:hypothetical protein